MAANYTRMQNDLEYYKKRYQQSQDRIIEQERRMSALRGVITRKSRLISELKSLNQNNGAATNSSRDEGATGEV